MCMCIVVWLCMYVFDLSFKPAVGLPALNDNDNDNENYRLIRFNMINYNDNDTYRCNHDNYVHYRLIRASRDRAQDSGTHAHVVYANKTTNNTNSIHNTNNTTNNASRIKTTNNTTNNTKQQDNTSAHINQ